MYLQCMFLSAHLHNPCLARRGHDLSDDDNIMGLWLLGVHGQVVAHIGKDIVVVVPLNVLVVAICGGFLQGTVSRNPAYRNSLPRGVVVTYVTVLLVFDYPFSFYRSGFNHTLVVEYNVIPWSGQFRGQRAGDCLGPIHLLGPVHAKSCAVVSVVYAPSCSSVLFRPVSIPPCGGGFSRVVYGDPVDLLLAGQCLVDLEGFLWGWFVRRVNPAIVSTVGSRPRFPRVCLLVLPRALRVV